MNELEANRKIQEEEKSEESKADDDKVCLLRAAFYAH